MPESFPTAILWLVTGLAAGTAGGYFWGADSQLIADPTQQRSATEVSHGYQQQIAGSATITSTAIPDPTGLRLVGTVVQPERSKSKAWLLQVSSETTQSYGEGDVLPGGYKLVSIGADDLQVTKDGSSFVIRRISTSSGLNTNPPCQAIAQNSRGIESNELGHSNHAGRTGGITSRHRSSRQAGQQGAQGSQRNHKTFKSWSGKTIGEGDSVLENSGDAFEESSDEKDNATNTAR